MITLYGVPFSAHTRKVILCAAAKGIDYRLEPVVPLDPPDGWRDLSPTGKIPVLTDGDFTVADSSVICAYLERRFPEPPLYPHDARDYARALWLEEYVDGELQRFVLHDFLLETVFAPAFLNRETNRAVVDNALQKEIPARFAQLDAWLSPGRHAVGDRFTIADATLASILINYHYGGERIDARAYPGLAGYFEFIRATEPVRSVLEAEQPAAGQVPGLDRAFVDGTGR